MKSGLLLFFASFLFISIMNVKGIVVSSPSECLVLQDSICGAGFDGFPVLKSKFATLQAFNDLIKRILNVEEKTNQFVNSVGCLDSVREPLTNLRYQTSYWCSNIIHDAVQQGCFVSPEKPQKGPVFCVDECKIGARGVVSIIKDESVCPRLNMTIQIRKVRLSRTTSSLCTRMESLTQQKKCVLATDDIKYCGFESDVIANSQCKMIPSDPCCMAYLKGKPGVTTSQSNPQNTSQDNNVSHSPEASSDTKPEAITVVREEGVSAEIIVVIVIVVLVAALVFAIIFKKRKASENKPTYPVRNESMVSDNHQKRGRRMTPAHPGLDNSSHLTAPSHARSNARVTIKPVGYYEPSEQIDSKHGKHPYYQSQISLKESKPIVELVHPLQDSDERAFSIRDGSIFNNDGVPIRKSDPNEIVPYESILDDPIPPTRHVDLRSVVQTPFVFNQTHSRDMSDDSELTQSKVTFPAFLGKGRDQHTVTVMKVVHEYNSTMDDEISLALGQQILVVSEYDDAWALGVNKSTGDHGVFPLVCVARLGDNISRIHTKSETPQGNSVLFGKRMSSVNISPGDIDKLSRFTAPPPPDSPAILQRGDVLEEIQEIKPI